jgi:hypothetical protein
MQSMLRIHAMSGYEMLYECYLTGQMSDRQLQAHLDDDEVFRLWFARRSRMKAAASGRK